MEGGSTIIVLFVLFNFTSREQSYQVSLSNPPEAYVILNAGRQTVGG